MPGITSFFRSRKSTRSRSRKSNDAENGLVPRISARYTKPYDEISANHEGEFNFIPDILKYGYEDRENPLHLAMVAQQDPIAYFIVNDVTNQALDDGYLFVDRKTGQVVENLRVRRFFEIAQDLEFDLHRMDAMKKARTFKWAILVCDKSGLASYSPLDCEILDYDERGWPKTYKLREKFAGSRSGKVVTFDSSQVIHMVSELSFNRAWRMEGIPVLWPIWDDLILLRWLKYSMTEFGARVGGGFFLIMTDAKTRVELERAAELFRGINSRKNAVVGEKFVKDVRQVVNQAMNVGYSQFIETLYDSISAGSGIPKDIIRGASSGTLSTAQVNEKSLYRKIKSVQNHDKQYIRQFIRWLAKNVDARFKDLLNFEIKYKREYELSEIEMAQINQMRMATADLMLRTGLFTLNEIRQQAGFDPVYRPEFEKFPGESGINPQDFTINVKGLEE